MGTDAYRLEKTRRHFREIADELRQAGYREIRFIVAIEEPQSTDERLEGFKLAFERYGLRVDERFVKLGHFNQETGAQDFSGDD